MYRGSITVVVIVSFAATVTETLVPEAEGDWLHRGWWIRGALEGEGDTQPGFPIISRWMKQLLFFVPD